MNIFKNIAARRAQGWGGGFLHLVPPCGLDELTIRHFRTWRVGDGRGILKFADSMIFLNLPLVPRVFQYTLYYLQAIVKGISVPNHILLWLALMSVSIIIFEVAPWHFAANNTSAEFIGSSGISPLNVHQIGDYPLFHTW